MMTETEKQLLKRVEELEKRVLILETNPSIVIHDHEHWEDEDYEL